MSIHPLVLSQIQVLHATAAARLERLRSERNAIATVTPAQQNRAIGVGKLIREAEAIETSWADVTRAVLGGSDVSP